VCSSTGDGLSHSMEVGCEYENNQGRLDARASHKIHINMVTERKEIKEPRDDTTFQVVKQSG